ncbi:trithorax group protein osa isoform 2-T6 [Glossina fuscipes fuscipes]
MNEKIKSPSAQGGPASSGGPTSAGNGGGGGSGGNSQSGPTSASSSLGSGPPVPNNGGDGQGTIPHPYGPPGAGDPVAMAHYHLHQQPPHPQHMPPHPGQGGPGGPPPNTVEHPNKDDYGQSPLGGPPPPPPGGHHPVYGRYHHADPTIDPYRYGHAPLQQQAPPPGGKPQQSLPGTGAGISSPGRPPPQRYIPGQPPQGPTPTLNSLLQSSHPPPPPQHRYTNSYDPQQHPQQPPPPQQQQQQPPQTGAGGPQQQQPGGPTQSGPPPPPPHSGPPPPPHQAPYGAQQGVWAPPPRPYSPQLGPSQQYRTPPPTNTSRGQSPYPPTHGQNSGSYPSSPQQAQQQQQQQSGGGNSGSGGSSAGGPPPPQSSNQGTTPSQYSPYPQRYPTPPGPATGPNHRTAYSTHQYPEPNRPWPGGSSPAPSPGPGGHPLPPASPHHTQHGGPPPSSSPSHAPSPSPQPSQASPSPHQELIGQNSNDSSSGGGHSGMGSGPPGTPNSQQVMRPTPSPTGSSGSRSMSPAVAQNHPISRPSSNQSSSGPMQQPGGGPPPTSSQATSQQQSQNSNSVSSNSPQQGPPGSVAGGPPGSQQPPQPPNQNVSNLSSQPLPQGSGGSNIYPLPPHMHGSYKMGGQNPGPQTLLSAYPPPPSQQAQQYSQGSYPPRPQYPPSGYAPTPPNSSQPSSVNSMPPGSGPQQYAAGRPILNHGGGSPYPAYQNWVPPSGQGGGPVNVGSVPPGAPGTPGGAPMGNHIQSKGTPPPPQSGGSSRPLNYLKQHLQHKGGYGPGTGPPQGYGNGPGMHPGMPMGPPHHMGPPHGPTNMGPPTSTPPQPMMGGAVGTPEGNSGPPPPPDHISQDNGISSSGSSSSASGPPHPVTSVVTTGPDGTPMDEASQQSTLSNASAASGEDPQCTTPKSRKNDPYVQSHLAPPSTSPVGMVGTGPHAGHTGVPGEEYEMSSPPNWARTPASPGFNSHVPQQDTFRTTGATATPISASAANKKSDSLCKLYEMDDAPERHVWLDKLRAFMDERRTPITACPTISKQPLDLYRLYLYVKDRGGFVEVTKSKTWKDIAGLLGIGASSSAAYTLRKHYTKNLLAFECHYDRGDIDPLPIIQQVEAGTKKKSTKAASVPSPAGSSNSQDAFPAPGTAANASIDGYPPYPGGYPGAGPQPDYGAAGQMPRPPSQSNAQSPHPGNTQNTAAQSVGDNISVNNPFDEPVGGNSGVNPGAAGSGSSGGSGGAGAATNANSNSGPPQPPPASRPPYPPGGPYPPPVSRTPGSPYPGQPGAYGQYGSGDQYNASGQAGQFGQQQGQFPPQNRNMYPPYGPEGEAPPTGSNQYGPYGNRPYSQPPPGSSQTSTPPVAPSSASGPGPGGPATGGSPYPPGQQEYYRPPEQSPQPRRHPDFVKDSQPYPGYSARPQIYGGWQGSSNQYRSQYPSTPSPQTWGSAPPRTAAPAGGPLGPPGQQAPTAAGTTQWDQHRYPPQQQPPPPQQQPPYQQQSQQQPPPPQWAQAMSASGANPPGAPSAGTSGSPLRSPATGQQQRIPASAAASISGSPGPQPGQQVGPPTTSNAPTGLPSSSLGKPPFSMPPPQTSSAGVPVPAGSNAMAGVMSVAQKPVTPVGSSGAVGAPPPPPQAPFPQFAKKEIVFPPDSVEATSPVLYRRKRLTKTDVCPVDPWRIFMAMRSGLLTECTWSLDVLNVLLFDDSTVQYFGLSHLPGLLTLLLEHFQKNLAAMFKDEGDEDKPFAGPKNEKKRLTRSNYLRNEKRNREAAVMDDLKNAKIDGSSDNEETDEDEDIDLGQVRVPPNPEERVVLLAHTPNYTMMSRKGLPVRLQSAEHDIFVIDDLKPWDAEGGEKFEESVPVGCNAWTYGFTDPDTNAGIIDVFKSEIIDIPFARYIKTKGKSCNKCHKIKIEPDSVKSEHDSQNECDRDEEVEARLQQHAFNKKRRLFNNSNPIGCTNNNNGNQLIGEPSESKKLKLQAAMEEEEQKVSLTHLEISREETEAALATSNNTDSDCREIDMELETISSSKDTTKEFDPKSTARDPALVLQRRRSSSSLEDECYTRDESSLYLVNESQDALARRCICISNIFRNLSFVPGNETILAKSPRFLAVLGRLLLLYHEHLPRPPKNRNYDRGSEEDTDFSDSCSSLQGEREWWWDYLISIRENMLVIMANIAGHLELTRYEELIARPLVDGLLHWAVCPSAHGQDPFPSCGPTSSLSPQRLALEALCKLCVTDNNVDLVIATPPFARLEKLCAVLTRHLCRNEDQVLREFSVNLLHYLAAADSAMSRTVALQSPCISYLVAFIEQAEQTALGVANQHGINYLRENPDSMGTSLDMLRRAAGTLLHLAKHPDNRSLFMQQEQRLLGLVMSHILDQQVALIISRVLFQVSRGPGTTINSLEYRIQQKQQQKSVNIEKKASGRELISKEATNAAAKTEMKMEPTETVNSISHNSCDGGLVTADVINGNKIISNSSSSSVMVSADSENSNSSSQITPAAAYNDVSNSSTNSNSCGTAVSSQSNMSNNSSSSSNICNSQNNNLSNNYSNATANYIHSNSIATSEHLKSNILSSVTQTNTPLTSNNSSNVNLNSNSIVASTVASSQAPPPPSPSTAPAQAPTANTATTAAVA